MKEELNDNDNKLLAYCHNRKRHLSDIARHLGIDVKNVSVRIEKLKKLGLVSTEKVSNRLYVRSVKGDKSNDYFYKILKEIEKRGGEVTQQEYTSLLEYSMMGDDEDYEKFSSKMKLLHLHPPVLDKVFRLNDNAKTFLKEYKK